MTEVFSVATGNLIELRDVKDEVFSNNMLGDGFGIVTNDAILYSPVSGKVTMIYDTGHAIGIQCEDETDILIHIGIDTVELGGIPFESMVQVGTEVNTKTPLTRVNWNHIRENGFDETVLIISLGKQMIHQMDKGFVNQGASIATVVS